MRITFSEDEMANEEEMTLLSLHLLVSFSELVSLLANIFVCSWNWGSSIYVSYKNSKAPSTFFPEFLPVFSLCIEGMLRTFGTNIFHSVWTSVTIVFMKP